MGMGNRLADFTPIFDFSIDLNATALFHAEDFKEFTEYMDTFMEPCSVLFEESSTKWVPLDFLKYTYRHDKNYRFRAARIIKGLTNRDLKVADEDTVEELNMGDIGTQFLSWEMILVCMILEGVEKGKSAKKESKHAMGPAILVTEMDVPEEALTEQEEASMALILMQGDQPEEEDVRLLEGEEVIEEVPELQMIHLHPIIIDDQKYLFLHDISKTLGLREDEALSVLKMHSTMVDPDTVDATPQLQVDFLESDDLASLEYHADDNEGTLEETVAKALVSIGKVATEYESVPECAFQPHKPLVARDMASMGSINLTKPRTIEEDHASEVSFVDC